MKKKWIVLEKVEFKKFEVLKCILQSAGYTLGGTKENLPFGENMMDITQVNVKYLEKNINNLEAHYRILTYDELLKELEEKIKYEDSNRKGCEVGDI